MSSPSTSSSLQDFFDSLGSVDQDLMIRVLVDMVEASSESATQPVKFVQHQLRREIKREQAKVDVLKGQLQETERLIGKLRTQLNGSASAGSAFLLATMRDRAEDLHRRIGKVKLDEKVARLNDLKQTLLSARTRTDAAKALLQEIAPDRLKEMPDARSRIP